MRVHKVVLVVSFGVACSIAVASSAQEFGYGGPIGPHHWGALSPAWKTCATGTEQSPVDLGPLTLLSRRVRHLSLEYGETHGAIFNNGHTIEVETEGENVLRLDESEYRLVQFHFHTPSEHTAAGRGYDMEMHLVHRGPSGQLAVIGVLMRRGPSTGALDAVFDHLPDGIDVHEELEVFDSRRFLPRSLTHYEYAGSLTTPPCSENVRWMVLATPITISDEHMAQFAERVRFNSRPVQRRFR